MKPQTWIKNLSSVRWNRHHFGIFEATVSQAKQLGWMQTSDTNLWKRWTFFKTLLLWKYLSRKTNPGVFLLLGFCKRGSFGPKQEFPPPRGFPRKIRPKSKPKKSTAKKSASHIHEGITTRPRNKMGFKIYLVVSTPLKHISQIGSFPQIGAKIKHVSNHQPEIAWH